MNLLRRILIAIAVVFLLSSPGAAQNETAALKDWVDGEVSLIITRDERTEFKDLKTDQDRQIFIDRFWLRRDTTPETAANEIKAEFYTRVDYANKWFPSAFAGWRTDRGRLYIIAGPPNTIDRRPMGDMGIAELKDTIGCRNCGAPDLTDPLKPGSNTGYEVWTYYYLPMTRERAVITFRDTTMTGDYALGNSGSSLQEIEEEHDLRGSIFDPPEIKSRDLESVVTTKLSFALLPFSARTDFIRDAADADGRVLMPITIQINYKDLAVKESGDVNRVLATINGTITTGSGLVVEAFEDTIAQDIPANLLQQALGRAALYQKTVRLRPGPYSLNVVVKDGQTSSIGTIDQTFEVPKYSNDSVAMSSLILADTIEALPETVAGAPFVIGNHRVRPNVKGEFSSGQTMNLWLQAYNLKVEDLSQQAYTRLETVITQDGREVQKIVEDNPEATTAELTFVQEIPLETLAPGEYRVQVTVIDSLTNGAAASEARFTVR